MRGARTLNLYLCQGYENHSWGIGTLLGALEIENQEGELSGGREKKTSRAARQGAHSMPIQFGRSAGGGRRLEGEKTLGGGDLRWNWGEEKRELVSPSVWTTRRLGIISNGSARGDNRKKERTPRKINRNGEKKVNSSKKNYRRGEKIADVSAQCKYLKGAGARGEKGSRAKLFRSV